jgi:ATP-dependent Lon protease
LARVRGLYVPTVRSMRKPQNRMENRQVGAVCRKLARRVQPGPMSLILTGQLGEVMKESARAALTYATNNAPALGIPPHRLDGAMEAHIHVPAGAIPKDGPSAGIAIATALVSEMAGRPVRRDVAMTGEITLRGRVLPIGGLKEKVLGAHRAGIKHIIIPSENDADLEDVPEEVRQLLSFHPVSTLRDVLRIAFADELDVTEPAMEEEVPATVGWEMWDVGGNGFRRFI